MALFFTEKRTPFAVLDERTIGLRKWHVRCSQSQLSAEPNGERSAPFSGEPFSACAARGARAPQRACPTSRIPPATARLPGWIARLTLLLRDAKRERRWRRALARSGCWRLAGGGGWLAVTECGSPRPLRRRAWTLDGQFQSLALAYSPLVFLRLLGSFDGSDACMQPFVPIRFIASLRQLNQAGTNPQRNLAENRSCRAGTAETLARP